MNTFSETQRFKQWWLWVIVIGALVVPLIITIFHIPANSTGNKTADLLVGAAMPVFVILLFSAMRLKTEINAVGIHYRFVPFHLKTFTVEWNEVEKAYIRQYKPLPEYGGWGLRAGLGGVGRAYNVSGNIGLQLHLKTGKKMLFGTQKPEEIKALLAELVKNGVITKGMTVAP